MQTSSHTFCFETVVTESLKMLEHVLVCLRAEKPEGLKEARRALHTLKGNFSYFKPEGLLIVVMDLEAFFDGISGPDFSLSERYLAIEKTHNLYWNLTHFRHASVLQKYPSGDDFYPIGKAMVEDLAQKLDKKISFSIKGGEKPLPGEDWNEIFTYFTHFLRNAADHGLESAHERLEKGKLAEGKIEIEFFESPDSVEIHLRDDGRGIDWKVIALTEKEAFKKIFEDGFSTRKIITTESGMGIGMSALYAMVVKRNGRLEFMNEPGKGLTLVMVFPIVEEKRDVA